MNSTFRFSGCLSHAEFLMALLLALVLGLFSECTLAESASTSSELVRPTPLVNPEIPRQRIPPWSLGGIYLDSSSRYKGMDDTSMLLPGIGYEGEHLYIRGLTAGWRMLERSGKQNVTLKLTYDMSAFDPSDTSDSQLSLLDEREATLLGELSYQLRSIAGSFEMGVGGDIAGQHDGTFGDLNWSYPYRTQHWGITPKIGYTLNSSRINQHLYGISESEASVSGLNRFEAGEAGVYYIGLNGYYRISRHWSLMGNLRYSELDSDVGESPMLKQRDSTSMMFGISYRF